jgi:DNA-binding transcriptional MerR regulator
MQKLYYSISEICEAVGEEQHILRYWEKEFDCLKPKKNRAGNRIYSSKDLVIIQTIKRLLRVDKLSLKGAKEQLLKILDKDDDSFRSESFHPSVDNSSVLTESKSENNRQMFNKDDFRGIYKIMKETLDYLKAH